MLTTLMALQAGLPPLDFRNMIGRGKEDYIKAIQTGMAQNYRPMEKIFATIIRKTLRVREQK